MTTSAAIGVVMGTRPEAIKLSPVVAALRAAGAEVRVCLTGQHSELLDEHVLASGARTTTHLHLMTYDQTPEQVCSKAMRGIGEWLAREPLRWVVVQGDTTTAMAGALSAFYAGVPVAHVEAGLRTGDLNSPRPEEMHRRVIGQLASWHFAPTDEARANLLREGVDPNTIEVTGNTVIDAMQMAFEHIRGDRDIDALLASLNTSGGARPIILATAHRRETLDEYANEIGSALAAIARRGDCDLVFVRHPNPRVAEIAAHLEDIPLAHVIAPLGHVAFLALMQRAMLVLTDSGGVQEEATALGRPVLILRRKTERPETLIGGNGILVGASSDVIVREVSRILDDPRRLSSMSQANAALGDGRASWRIAKRLAHAP